MGFETSKLSYWERKLFTDNIDFLIIGSGIVGMSTAYHLKLKYPKAKVLIIEKGILPSGATTKNAGFACFGSVTELVDDLEKNDENTVFSTVEKRFQGLNYLRQLIGDNNLSFQQNGSWDLIDEGFEIEKYDSKIPYLNQQLASISNEHEVYSKDSNSVQLFGFKGVKTSFYNRLEAQIDTSKLYANWEKLCKEKGVLFLNGVEVKALEKENESILVKSDLFDFSSKQVLICVNGFAQQFIQDDILPARAQVLITKPIENLPFEGTFHYQSGYYYFRNIDNRVLFGGGRNLDFKGETTTQLQTTELIIKDLKDKLTNKFLPNTPFEIDYHWAGIMGVGEKKMPIVKRVDNNISVAVRLGGMGVAIGSLVGKELADLN